MKVALINSVYGFGSTGKIVMNLCSIDGVTARAYYGRKSKSIDENAIKFNNFFGNANQAVQTFIFDNHAFSCKRATYKLVKKLVDFAPDIIHLHNLHGYYIHAGVLFDYLKCHKVKVVWTLHDCWAFTGHCPHFEAINCYKWLTRCDNCPIYHKYPFSFNKHNASKNYELKKKVFTSLDSDQLYLVTPSKWLKEQVERSFLNKYRCIVINNGIDLSMFKYCPFNQINDKFTILAVSSMWYEEKGLNDLVKLSHMINDEMKLIVIGLTKKQCDLFSKNTLCLQRTNDIRELVDYYNKADVFVNFTYEDTFPTVNLEAMACGLPVLTYKSGGSTEMVDDDCGCIVDKYDIDGMVDKLWKLKNREILFDRRLIANKMKQYDVNMMYMNYKQLYERVYNGKKD